MTLASAQLRTTAGVRAVALAAAVVFAIGVRTVVGSPDPAASAPGSLIASALLLAAAGAAGWRPSRPRLRALIIGVAGAAVLLGPVLLEALRLHLPLGAPPAASLGWAAAVVVVAVSEEVVLRGVLFDALAERTGQWAAVLLTAVLFGAMHVPLYGLTALPLDIAVGVWLGGLRCIAGVSASATAHTLADLATLLIR